MHLAAPVTRWLLAIAAAVVLVACSFGQESTGPAEQTSEQLRPASTSQGPTGPTSAATGTARAVSVRPCPGLPGVRCGAVRVPLYRHADADPSEDLTVRFRVYRRTDPSMPAREPVVAFEGGPGYGSIGSATTFAKMLGPLRRRHDLIVMDQRGTGASGAIDCPALQRGRGNYVAAVAACARRLGPAANAYGSASAADDLAAILRGLGVGRVDLYGDSYGTYLAQVFAVHHPELVRAVILDGAFNQSFDPFARDASAALRRAWKAVCERSAPCPGILRSIGAFARRLDAHPIVGIPPGRTRPVRLTARGLAQLAYDATYVFSIYRDLPAAMEAARAGDSGPILRLASEDLGSTGNGNYPRAYSAGLYMAVSCHDYPTIWSRAGSTHARRAQLRAAIGDVAPNAFAPFTKQAWLASLYEHQLVYGCLAWPAPSIADPPFPVGVERPDVPVLVLNGELDITTPFADARRAAAAFPNTTLVEIRNELHVSALYDFQGCAQRIARRFLRRLDAGDTTCADRIPPIATVKRFPTRLALAPEGAVAGARDGSTVDGRRAAWVATQTVADAFTRWYNVTYAGGPGLRGGAFGVAGPYLGRAPLTLTFREARFVDDVAVSGTAVWDRQAGAVRAHLVLAGAATGRIFLAFPTRRVAPVRITGVLDGRRVDLEVRGPPWAS